MFKLDKPIRTMHDCLDFTKALIDMYQHTIVKPDLLQEVDEWLTEIERNHYYWRS